MLESEVFFVCLQIQIVVISAAHHRRSKQLHSKKRYIFNTIKPREADSVLILWVLLDCFEVCYLVLFNNTQ